MMTTAAGRMKYRMTTTKMVNSSWNRTKQCRIGRQHQRRKAILAGRQFKSDVGGLPRRLLDVLAAHLLPSDESRRKLKGNRRKGSILTTIATSSTRSSSAEGAL